MIGNDTSGAGGDMCGGSRRRVVRVRVARRSPRCCWPYRPEWKRLIVVGQWASHPAAFTTQCCRNEESDRGDETLAALSTRVPRTKAALHTSLHPRMFLKTKEGTMGRGQWHVHTPRRLLYTIGDVNRGPRPRAHRYMLTHLCCDDTASYQTCITLH